MTYMLLLHCLHPYLLPLSFCHYSYYVIINYILLMILKYNAFYLLAEITLRLGLQSTEAYFPYIVYALFFNFFYYYVRRSVLFKIHAANIEASKFFVLFLSVTMENYSKGFPNASSMYMLLYNFHIFLREYRVARNTILIQRDVLWTGKI